MTASLSVMAVVFAGLLPVHPGAAGAADQRGFQITVSESGFNPNVVADVNVGDILMFNLDDQATDQHTVTFEDSSLCPGSRGAVPCWPELRFDDRRPNCQMGSVVLPGRRCMVVQDPGKTVRYHDAFNTANGGEIKVLGEPTTTSGPPTPPTTVDPTTTSSTEPPSTTTTAPHTTTTTAASQIRPFVIPDQPATTSTTAAPIPVVAGNTATPPSTASKDNKDKSKDKAKSKAPEGETATTAAPAPPGSMPPDSVFDPAALTPGPVVVPDIPGLPAPGDDGTDLESSAVLNLLDHEAPAGNDSLLLVGAAAFAFLLLVGALWGWLHRASRYDPA